MLQISVLLTYFPITSVPIGNDEVFGIKNIFSTVRPTTCQCPSKTCQGKSQQLLKEIERIYIYELNAC